MNFLLILATTLGFQNALLKEIRNHDGKKYAVGYYQILESKDHGNSWSRYAKFPETFTVDVSSIIFPGDNQMLFMTPWELFKLDSVQGYGKVLKHDRLSDGMGLVTSFDGSLLAWGKDSILRSIDFGWNWKNLSPTDLSVIQMDLKSDGKNDYVLNFNENTGNQLFIRNANYPSWEQVYSVSSDTLTAMCSKGDTIYMAGFDSLIIWDSKQNSGKAVKISTEGRSVFLETHQSRLYLGKNNSLLIYSSSGALITKTIFNDQYINDIDFSGDTILIASRGWGLHRSTDRGASWKPVNLQKHIWGINGDLFDFTVTPTRAVVASGNGVWERSHLKKNWTLHTPFVEGTKEFELHKAYYPSFTESLLNGTTHCDTIFGQHGSDTLRMVTSTSSNSWSFLDVKLHDSTGSVFNDPSRWAIDTKDYTHQVVAFTKLWVEGRKIFRLIQIAETFDLWKSWNRTRTFWGNDARAILNSGNLYLALVDNDTIHFRLKGQQQFQSLTTPFRIGKIFFYSTTNQEFVVSNDSAVFFTSTDLQTWKRRGRLLAVPSKNYVKKLSDDPDVQNLYYVPTFYGLYRTRDFRNWTEIHPLQNYQENSCLDVVITKFNGQRQEWVLYDHQLYEGSFLLNGLGIESLTGLIPKKFAVSLWPNPFNASITMDIETNRIAPILLSIFDVRGRLVLSKNFPSNSLRNRFVWNGKSIRGVQVPSGVYQVRIQSTGGEMIKKAITLLK